MRTKTMIPRLGKFGAVLTAICAVTFAAAVPAQGAPGRGELAANAGSVARISKAVKAYERAHPGDYIGLNRAIVAAGGDPVKFNFDRAGLYDLSPEQAQQAYDGARTTSAIGPFASIPTNAFSVSGYWSHSQDSDGEFWTYFGSWNFNNDYYSGGSPADAMAVATRDVSNSCFQYNGDGAWSFERWGADTSWNMNRRSADFDNVVYEVDDSSGANAVDRGTIYLSYQKLGSCGTSIYGKTFYEHNIDGCSCTWSFGISAGGLSIGYSQDDPSATRQRSTGLVRGN